ncbi:MAG TPA: indolepyruvate ferredoxin oxidoreductase subunit beta, partial [Candidatus Parcubacteria bacterium]|nr:indolepyruvate ferredoxin oxidoreductase subunit beta [Candidatus Parcubacteria bacterium]
MKKRNKNKSFNIVIVGIGGQGLITLLRIITEAANIEGIDLAGSELHGLAQRGGSVEVHVRFGKKVYSPLVKQGGADLIIALEAQESLRACYYASKKRETVFLVNDFSSKALGQNKEFSLDMISKTLGNFSQRAVFLPASQICQEKLKNSLVAGVYMLGFCLFKNILPLREEALKSAIEKIVPKKYLDLNLKAFDLPKRT